MANSDNENKPSVSNKIRKMREDRKLTQADLARMSGLSLSSIKAYENGIRNPKSESMEKIVTAVSRVPRIQVQDLKLNFESLPEATVKRSKTVELSDKNTVWLWKGFPLDDFAAGIMQEVVGAMMNSTLKEKEAGTDGKH
ncbi:helix-turn-helix transcriptional regulator [Lacticaseibacillus paracasei]|uniref:helix-turn-helix domain-containing protein n=1 Tax=Lacticaseibacillus paracasei TaxID=1597 RepID=UPI001BABEC23|nr:helix-turn-helix domain-containing protein [Lacticaseibacillus paracasei]MBS0990951.1 helix-turn-helix transcriptional regulator [Lacticaseibacillus paracasei]